MIRRRHKRSPLQVEALEQRALLAAAPIISEFMAVNSSTLQDEDGDYSDWIEILNAGDQSADLGGYWLTDRTNELTGWRFPDVALAEGETIVVFASGKNRDEAGNELHTDFRLDGDGDYLALVAPDGQTVVQEFAPQYPPQAADVAYGVSPDIEDLTLLAPGATGRYLVPLNNELEATWALPETVDTGWPVATLPIGFETGEAEAPSMAAAIQALNPLGHWRFEESAGTTAANAGSAGTSLDGTYNGGPQLGVAGADASFGLDAGNSAISLDGDNDSVTTGASPLSNMSAFSMMAMVNPKLQSANRVGLFGQNDAVEFGFISPTTVQVWTPDGGSLTIDYNQPFDEWHHIAVVGDGQNLRIYIDGTEAGVGGAATANYGASDSTFNIGGSGVFDATGNNFDGELDEVAIFDRALSAAEITSVLGGGAGGADDSLYTALLQTDIQAAMSGTNSSAYVRVPFDVADPSVLTGMTINVNYDDGFVAYLNGNEVLRVNAPGEEEVFLPFNAAATATNPDAAAVSGESINISDSRDALQPGANVLGIQLLNASATDPDAFLDVELLASRVAVDVSTNGYLTTPTPGDANNPVASDLGPLVTNETHSPSAPLSTEAVVVSAQVVPTLRNVAGVELKYRAMYGDEVTLTMVDDGTAGDLLAGDGIYAATIPANVAQPGEMLRWYIQATDVGATAGRLPRFEVAEASEYFGTLVTDPAIASNIDVLHWWVENASRAGTRGGTSASLYFAGEFYDNVFVRQRGGSTANNNVGKTNFKFDFLGEQFRFAPGEARVEEFNLNTTATDKSYIRQPLSFDTYAQLGTAASISFPMHVRRNDEFYGVFAFIEEPDDEMLERNGLDSNGALYKVYNEFTSSSSVRKKTRETENNSDLNDFITAVRTLEGEERHNYLVDNVDLPATLNYLVGTVLTHQNDNPHKNHFLYRDTEGSGEWTFLPWDNDLTWGSNWVGTSFSDIIYADDDVITEGPVPGHDPATIHPSHPFINSEGYREWNNHWNRLMDALLQDPLIRQMYLRRLRSGMDQLFGQPGTTDSYIDQQLTEYLTKLGPDAAADLGVWGRNGEWVWGENQSLADAIEVIRTEYLEVRRQHLYDTHSIDNIDPPEINVLIPEGSTASYFVPRDDSLAVSWTQPEFDDAAWQTGAMGFGFKTNNSDFDEHIQTVVQPSAVADGSTSVYIRVPFNVADPSQVEDLTFRAKYDDGFVVFLNGTEVASQNLRDPSPQTWDSRARSHSNAAAQKFENFAISEFTNLLVAGENVLAIHAINSSATSNDMLMSPELIDGVIQTVEIAGIPHSQSTTAVVLFDADSVDVSPVSGNQDEEYIKLDNPSDVAVDLTGWRIDGGIEHEFRPGTIIPAGGSLYVTPDVAAFRARAVGPTGGQGLLVQGGYRGHLSNFGDTLTLMAADGVRVASLQTSGAPSDVQLSLRVTELNYNPTSLDDQTEFVEITNVGASTLDVSGVSLTGGPQQPFVVPAGTQLAAGQAMVIAKNPAALLAATPGLDASRVLGPFVGNLSNQGERIKLDDALGNTVVDFDYSDSVLWPQAADGVGASLVLNDLSTPTDQLSKPNRWRASREIGGSPAAVNAPAVGVVINEVVRNAGTGQFDTIELHNASNQAVDLSGWSLSDDSQDLDKFDLPAGTVLAANAYLSVSNLGFQMVGNDDGEVWLTQTAAGEIAEFGDQVYRGAGGSTTVAVGQAWGRIPNGTGYLTPLATATADATNDTSAPVTSSVVISEVQYHPTSPSTAAIAVDPNIESSDLEYVELANVSVGATPVNLTGWRIRGGIDLDFEPGDSLAAQGSLLVISFNPASPANANRLSAFRTHYGLGNDVAIVGGYGGQLSNDFDRVVLQQPGDATGGALWVDEVVYDDVSPWPATADGNGPTIHRSAPSTFGSLATSWYASGPTPGSFTFGELPGDFNGDQQVDDADIDSLFEQLRSPTPDTSFDLTGDGAVDAMDRDQLILGVLGTSYGDSNLDRVFDSSDLVQVFQRGLYEDQIAGNARWGDGDWNGDGDFDTRDLVLAFQLGGYTLGAAEVESTKPTGDPLSVNLEHTLARDLDRALDLDAIDRVFES